uniref:Ag17 n=1 Tax=Clonorchis sinensis TaxID=79923 RepID=A0A6M3VY08_CLOSI|nr:Ag17 [Clonorchis sinensis]
MISFPGTTSAFFLFLLYQAYSGPLEECVRNVTTCDAETQECAIKALTRCNLPDNPGANVLVKCKEIVANCSMTEPNTINCTNGVLNCMDEAIKRESTGGATVLQPMLTTWISILVLLAAIIKGLEYLEMTSTAWSTNGE